VLKQQQQHEQEQHHDDDKNTKENNKKKAVVSELNGPYGPLLVMGIPEHHHLQQTKHTQQTKQSQQQTQQQTTDTDNTVMVGWSCPNDDDDDQPARDTKSNYDFIPPLYRTEDGMYYYCRTKNPKIRPYPRWPSSSSSSSSSSVLRPLLSFLSEQSRTYSNLTIEVQNGGPTLYKDQLVHLTDHIDDVIWWLPETLFVLTPGRHKAGTTGQQPQQQPPPVCTLVKHRNGIISVWNARIRYYRRNNYSNER
jgi:hypothetical protein